MEVNMSISKWSALGVLTLVVSGTGTWQARAGDASEDASTARASTRDIARGEKGATLGVGPTMEVFALGASDGAADTATVRAIAPAERSLSVAAPVRWADRATLTPLGAGDASDDAYVVRARPAAPKPEMALGIDAGEVVHVGGSASQTR
jgi:hypothetical protein